MGAAATALRNDTFVVLYREKEFSTKESVAFPETREELYALLTKLHSIITKTNQRMSEFTCVFPKGSLYPTEYDQFWAHRRRPDRKCYNVGAPFFVQRLLKNGKTKQKWYDCPEDFDCQFDNWQERSHQILILDMAEALKGDYVYERDIQKRWGDKEPLFTD